MTEFTRAGWMQNAGNVNTAEQLRNYTLALLTAGSQGATSQQVRGGVHPSNGNELAVTQTGSPSMAVLVKSGECVIPGTEGAKQGGYGAGNDADVTLTIAAAHATLNRIDIVIFRVRDSFYSGGVDTCVLEVVTGTPAASPSPPATPANSLLLAEVSVVALDTSITNGEITDKRAWLAATGGIIQATSTTRPAANTIPSGQTIVETNTSRLSTTFDVGATWLTMADPTLFTAWTSFSTTWRSSGTQPALGNGTIAAFFKLYGETGAFYIDLTIGSTSTFGTGYYFFDCPAGFTLTDFRPSGTGWCFDTSAQTFFLFATTRIQTNTQVCGRLHNNATNSGIPSATSPFTFATGDRIGMFWYGEC